MPYRRRGFEAISSPNPVTRTVVNRICIEIIGLHACGISQIFIFATQQHFFVRAGRARREENVPPNGYARGWMSSNSFFSFRPKICCGIMTTLCPEIASVVAHPIAAFTCDRTTQATSPSFRSLIPSGCWTEIVCRPNARNAKTIIHVSKPVLLSTTAVRPTGRFSR